MIRLGISPIGWTNDAIADLGAHIPFEQCLAEAAAAGFAGIELGRKFPADPAACRAALAAVGLVPVTGWYSGDLARRSVAAEWEAVQPFARRLLALGCTLLVYGECGHGPAAGSAAPLAAAIPFDRDPAYAARVEALALRLAETGLTMVYHPHMMQAIDSDDSIDWLMAATGPKVRLLLDTGHIAMSGGDWAGIARRWWPRIGHMHLKDIHRPVLAGLDPARDSFDDAVRRGLFTVPGTGDLDFAPLAALVRDRGYDGWCVVEAERAPDTPPAGALARAAFDHLAGLFDPRGRGARNRRRAGGRAMTGPLRLCLIGCGHLGRIRAAAALAWPFPVSLVVADGMPAAAARLAADLGLQAVPMDIALRGAFDAVIVSSAAPAHADHLAALSAAPAPVFCEKPLALSLAETGRIAPALAALAGRLQIGFNRRFDAGHRLLRDRIADGALGRIEQVRIVSRDHVPPRPGGLGTSAGIIAETSIHDLDKTRWLLGEEIAEVTCAAGALVDPAYAAEGHADTVTMVLRSVSGTQVVIQNGWRAAYGYDQRVEVFGAAGELRLPNPAVSPAPAPAMGGLMAEPATLPGWAERYQDSFVAELHAFLDGVRNGTALAPGLDDALAAQRLVEAARQAAATGARIALSGPGAAAAGLEAVQA